MYEVFYILSSLTFIECTPLCALYPQNKTLTWDTGNTTLPDLTDCMKQAVRSVPALLFALAYLIGCRALLRSQRPAHLDDVGFSWLLFMRVRYTPDFYVHMRTSTCFRAFEYSNIGLKLVVTVLFGAASVGELVHNIVSRDTFAYAATIQIAAPAIEIFAVVRSVSPLVN